MCAKTPKIAQPVEKDPQYLANPFLDGLQIGKGTGRNQLRTDLGSPLLTVPAPSGVALPAGSSATSTPGLVTPSATVSGLPSIPSAALVR